MSKIEKDLTLAPRLRQRVTIQAPVDAADAAGGVNRSWVMHARIWAEVVPLGSGAKEAVLDGRVNASSRTRFTIRYRDDITEAMRIAYDGENYNIRSITDLYGRGIAMEIIAERGVTS